jgi:hypothetical protein
MPNYVSKFAFLAAAVTAGAGFAAADEFDKKTVVTINEAVQLPNATLQPGTYVVKLFRTDVVNRNTVQFFDKDEKHLITTVVAFPNLRLRPSGKTEFAFWEVPAGKPKALRAWFYPGEEFGQEFAYPKAEAATISAGNSGATVPATDEQSNVASTTPAQPSASTAEPVAPVEHAATAEPAPAPAATPEPAPAPVEVAQAAPPAPTVTPQEPAAPAPTQSYSSDAQRVSPAPASSDKLPKTASNLPLIGLIGMLSFASAAALNLALHRR